VARNEGVEDGLALLVMALDPFVISDPYDDGAQREEVRRVSAGRLIGCLHHTLVAARVAGEEFLVLAEGGARDDVVALADQILMAVRWPDPLLLGGTSVTASVGIAFPRPAMSAEQLLINADNAMYAARHGGGNRHQLFDESLRESALSVPVAT
jgi:diguanylate cyclase (GGDEF)-like protein